MALRDDPPKGARYFLAPPQGFANSCDMIAVLANVGDFNIRFDAYLHRHPDAVSLKKHVDRLKCQIDFGA